MKILLTGDSITAAGRDIGSPTSMGEGYAATVAAALPEHSVLNTGINGNRVPDLQQRWEVDALAHAPDVLSIAIGVNDTWHKYVGRLRRGGTADREFEDGYRELLQRAREAGVPRIIVVEPFLIPADATQQRMRADLDAKIAIIRRLVAEFGTDLVTLDGAFAEEASWVGADSLVLDGVHPTDAGHQLIADRWLAGFHRER